MMLSLYVVAFILFHTTNVALPQAVDSSPCQSIVRAVSSASEVFFPGNALYEKGISHWAVSSTEESQCVVEAGSPEDLGTILVILGRTRTQFAVKGGGHTTNRHFSSTTGVHISLGRFSRINYNPSNNTVIVGAGLIFDDVYSALEPFNVTVVGGRVSGIGVSGFTLGGGFSWKTNQYGLALDNVLAFQLVTPNGHMVEVTQESDSELFFGLKGGQNNFGVVTELTLRTHPQTEVWGGLIAYGADVVGNITEATVVFQETVTDPKAAIITGYNSIPDLAPGQVTAIMLLFYDAPTPPPGIFDNFLSISSLESNVGTRTYISMIQSSPTNFTTPTRDQYQFLPNLKFTKGVGDLLANEALAMGELLANKTAIVLSYDAEIFLPTIFSHNKHATAYPPVRNIPFQPFNIAYEWTSAEFDEEVRSTLAASQQRLIQGQIALGQNVEDVPWYPNYASTGTPLGQMYGANLPALRALKQRIDPDNVMGLAGGWKF